MAQHVAGHLFDAEFALEEVLEVDGSLEDFVEFFDVGDAFGLGQGEEFGIEGVVLHEHRVGRELVVEGQGGAVVDAEGFEGALAVGGEIHRGAAEADVTGVGQD